MTRLLAILGGAALLAWPAALNGYPLVFIDSVSYLGLTLFPEWPWDKTPAYGAWLHLFHWGWSLWPALAAQALVVSHLLWVTQRALRGGVTPTGHAALCAGLALLTTAPWFVATLMPDIFAPVAALCVLLLGFARLPRLEAIWLAALGAIAIASHLSHLPTAAALVALALLVAGLRAALRAGAPVLLAVAGLVAANAWAVGQATLSPNGAIFLLARLQADGPAAQTIHDHCPQAAWHLCGFADALPMDSDAFLWDPRSPLNRQPDGTPIPMGGMRGAPEARTILAMTLRERPVAVTEAMLRNTLRQMARFAVGDTLGATHLAASARRAIARLPASEFTAFDAGAQMRGVLRDRAAPWLLPHRWVVLASLPLALLALWRAIRARERQVAGMLAGLLLAVAVNAFATGALSAPIDRYQARIVWLIPLAAALGLAPRFGRGPERPDVIARQDYGMDILFLVIPIFLIAGLVKGVAGFGLPTISIALLALFRPLPEAMALMLVPSLATNLWQAFAGGTLRLVAPRIGVFLLCSALAAFISAGHLARADALLLSGLLGICLIASASVALAAPALPAPAPRTEAWLAPPMGLASGAIAGFTGSYLVPAAPWLQAIRLPREQFVQGFGLAVVLVNGAIAAGLAGGGMLPATLGLASCLGVVPAFLGMEAGRRLRLRLDEVAFRRVVQMALGVLGAWLVVRAFA